MYIYKCTSYIIGLVCSLLLFIFSKTAAEHSTSPVTMLKPPLRQVVEVTGSESPSTVSWNTRNQRARNDLSRARLRAIESSLENGQIWVPPSPSHRKTWEEEVIFFPRIIVFAFGITFYIRE